LQRRLKLEDLIGHAIEKKEALQGGEHLLHIASELEGFFFVKDQHPNCGTEYYF
jgi:hypothetical protein